MNLPSKNYSKYDFHTNEKGVLKKKGLNERLVKEISLIKKEPAWMTQQRLRALKIFTKMQMPKFGPRLDFNFDDIYYYIKPAKEQKRSWDDVPEEIKKTFERLGVPEAERAFLGGVGAQFESEMIYHNIKKDLEKKGVIFLSMDQALHEHEELVKKYFSSVVSAADNKFAALNSAVWSGGTFLYVPKNVQVEIPLQAYFRINSQNAGQFERTLIISEPGSYVHYVEGCFTAGTQIVTANGTKPIEKITKEDMVLTHDIKYKRVYHTQKRQYTGRLYTIEYYGDTSQKIEVTEEHPFLAVKRQIAEYKNTDWDSKWVNAGELEKGDYIAIPIDRSTETDEERIFEIKIGTGRHGFKNVNIKIKTDKDFFRLLGYYLSEGSIVGGHYLHFTFNEKERLYINDAKYLLEKYFGKKPLEMKPYKNGITITLCSTAAARFFDSQFGKGAAKKSTPKWVMRESSDKQKELITGFWRGDGSFMMKQYSWGIKRMFRMNTISKILAQNLRDILLRLNIFGSINMQKRKGNRNNMYCIYIGGCFLKEFSKIVECFPSNEVVVGKQIAFQVLRQTNAKSYTQITESYVFVPIKNIFIKNVENVPVYNFSVEDDESYVANGIIVHNCTAPTYSQASLHAAVVELIALPGSRIRYTTIQNWSNNVYNLVTKRAHAHKNSIVEWIDGNLGSGVTMKYPAVHLLGEGASADVLSIVFAGKNQTIDAGSRVIHAAPETSSRIVSKSISKDGGKSIYRGLVRVAHGAKKIKSKTSCDALILDKRSSSDTIPRLDIKEKNVTVVHEASAGKINEEHLFYLMSRGLKRDEAEAMIVSGFIEQFTKELPLEYAIELNRLIQLQMEGAVG